MNESSIHARWRATLVVLALIAAPAAAQDDRLYFLTEAPVQVLEGDHGTKDVLVRWQLEGTPQREVSFDVSTDADTGRLTFEYEADAGIDYDPIAPVRVVVPAGQRSGTVTVRIRGDLDVEPTQRFFVHFRNIVGAVSPGQFGYVNYAASGIDILNDDEPPPMPPFVAHDDYVAVRWRGGPQEHSGIDPFRNDVSAPQQVVVTTTIVVPPQHGTATPGAPDMVSQSSIDYVPDLGYVGPDRLRYRICSGGYCDEADVAIDVVRFLGPYAYVSRRAGRLEVAEVAPAAMPSIRLEPSPLVAPVVVTFQAATDPTPADAFDGPEGRQFQLFAFPALASGHAEWYLAAKLASGHYASYGKVDVYVGVDLDGDGAPSADEVLCVVASRQPSCLVPYRQVPGVDAWWVMVHSRHPDVVRYLVNAWEVPVVEGDGSLVATGPGHLAADELLPITLSWDDDSMIGNAGRFGIVRIFGDEGEALGDMPIGMQFSSPGLAPTMLVPGKPRTFALASDHVLRTIFFDVPAGASRVRIAMSSGSEVDYWLWKHDGFVGWDETNPTPGAAPDEPSGAVVSSDAGVDAELVLEGSALQPGRWFLVVRNASGAIGEATVELALEGVAPVVRPGSYFDAERPGSGVFLYPAGGDWAGLWYTYRPDEHSTWYYLQGAAPGADGLWVGGIYRAAWDGKSRNLTRVGTATVAPTGEDAFQFSYTIDGETGTRPHAALGRGCPVGDSGPVDISTHWFDPAHDGTGFSVQMWEDYEYYAAFIYDRMGRPTFLAAELGAFGGADATAALQVMKGACPTCSDPYGYGPFRYDAGELRRTLGGGSLATFEVDAIWEVDFRGESIWSSVDRVQTLGGPGTTQGCEP